MPTTVKSAFNYFMEKVINLDPNKTSKARNSRNWLVNKIHEVSINDSTFPLLYADQDIYYGSFARHTKKRELDDIDIMIGIHAQESTYVELTNHTEITVPESATTLRNLCHDGTNKLNSRKVINKFISKLANIDQYKKAEIHRDLQAATLTLTSYEWNFDIVPSFFTKEDAYNKTYYLIPDGKGNWMKTDPRIDRDKVKAINKKHNGNVLNVIRIMKYWNKRPTMPLMQSYLIENMILDYYDSNWNIASDYVNIEISKVLLYINNHVDSAVYDPKGIQGDINKLTFDERNKIKTRSGNDYYKAIDAVNFEENEDYRSSIRKWEEIFGGNFPKYQE